MNNSWIAIADESGLRCLVLEEQHTIPFALRRAERENAQCFWAVLSMEHARYIRQQLFAGQSLPALHWLERLATNIGRVAMPEPGVPDWLSEYVTIPDDRDKEWSS